MALRQLFAGENLYLYTTRILSPKVMQHLAEVLLLRVTINPWSSAALKRN